jgi:hypothetical protein
VVRVGPWGNDAGLERRRQTAEGEQVQQEGYGVEANLVFPNGLTLAVLSAFLSASEADPDAHKPDGERKAFPRVAARLKNYLPRRSSLRLRDGL